MLVGSLLCRQQSGYEYALLQAFIRKVKQFDLLRQAVIVSGCRILIWGKGNSEQVVSLLGNIIEEWYAASHIQFSAEIVCLNKKSFNTLDELSRVVYQADTSQFWEQAGIRIPDTGTMILAPSLDLETFCSQFVDRVFLVGVDTLDAILYKLLDELKMRRSTREGVVQVILDFFSLVTDKIDELGITIEITTLRQQLQKIVVERDNISQLRVVLNSFINKLVDKIYSTKKTSTLAAVDWAQKFIQDNYRSDITLEVIAGKLYLSPSYFSRIFKKHTGQGFSQYINSIRMEKAKSLLLTGKYSVAEVADRVGIQDPSYFHHIFKKYHNATPGYFIGNPKQAFSR
jgi:AraC-type DNA-binding domain-containing proteins